MVERVVIATDSHSGKYLIPDPPARLHFVGIGGIGVSGLARILRTRGYAVSGSDLIASDVTADLQDEGIAISVGHDPANVGGADVVITTAAANDDNVELAAARASGIPVVKRAVVLGHLARDFRTLAVAGSHGKSTTSGMAAVALDVAGLQPRFAIGAISPHFGTNARDSEGDYFVVEADEYDYSFLQLDPDVAIVTNIEHDHPDLFPDLEGVLDAFSEFVARIRPGGTLVLSENDPGCHILRDRLEEEGDFDVLTFGVGCGDWALEDERRIRGPGDRILELRLAVPGRHNRLNALAVLAAADAFGIAPERMLEGLSRFNGIGRRFEVLREDPALVVVSDYAHHPTEIEATIRATRERYPDRRVVSVFQPHTYSRTAAMISTFASALDMSDQAVLAEIYPARETDDLGVSSATIARRMKSPVVVAGSPEDAASTALRILREGDVVLVLGAGDIVRSAALIAKEAE